MKKLNIRFLLVIITVGIINLIVGCNQADKDVVPAKIKNNPVVATSDVVKTLPGGRVVVDLLKNDRISANAGISLLKNYLKKGSAEFIKQGIVMYTPNDSTSGTDTLAYTICPPGQPCDTGAVQIAIIPNIPDTIKGAAPDFATTKPGIPVGIDVLKNDNFSDSTNQDSSQKRVEIVQPSKNGSTTVANGYYVIYTPNQGFTGKDWFVYGVRKRNANDYLGYGVVTITVKDSSSQGCIVKAVNDKSVVHNDTLTSNGSYIYIDVLSNDELCNKQLTQVVTNNGGFNDVSFENNRLKIKVFSGDESNGPRTVRYALKENGVSKSEADVQITFQTGTNGCIVRAMDDTLTVKHDTLSNNGTYIYVDVLSNDEQCNNQLTQAVINNGGFNDVSFENGFMKIKMYATDPKKTYILRYSLEFREAIKSQADVKIIVQ